MIPECYVSDKLIRIFLLDKFIAIDADDNGVDIYETKIDGIGFHTLSDVHDALYCHNGCFLAEADSLEGADKLAVIALRN